MNREFQNEFWHSTQHWPASLKRPLAVAMAFILSGTGWYYGCSQPKSRSELTSVVGLVTSLKLRPAVGPLAEPAKDGKDPQGLTPFLGITGYPDEIRLSQRTDFQRLSVQIHIGDRVEALIIPASSNEDHPDLIELSIRGIELVPYEQYVQEFRSQRPWMIAAGLMFAIVGVGLMLMKLPTERPAN